MRPIQTLVSALAVVTLYGCADKPTAPELDSSERRADQAAERRTVEWLRSYIATPRSPTMGEPAVLAGAGDIARCYPGAGFRQYRPPGPNHPAQQTSRLLDRMPGATVMALGDNAYEFGSPFDYLGCYHPTWGRHRERTRPATGNHEYLTPGATGYFLYFGRRSAPPLGYYSYDIGKWHIAVVNSTPQVYLCFPPEGDELPGFPQQPAPPPGTSPTTAGRLCAGDAAQQAWLAQDLASNRHKCTAVYYHHPRFSSGKHGDHFQMQKIWDIMYANGVELVLDGHDHLYERFARMNAEGEPDDRFGMRQITVGTGGAEFYAVNNRHPQSEVVINDRHGVLALALDDGRFAWAFVTTDGTIADSGEEACHDAPGWQPPLPGSAQ